MADSVEVGNLVVRLIADAKQLEGALQKGGADFRKFGKEGDKASKQVQKSADAMAKSITSVVSRLAGLAAAYVSVNSLIGAFNRQMETVTGLDHLSQVTGVAVERLSELRNVALATGVDFQTVSQAFSQFGARMAEALSSPTSRGSQALRALSVDVRDAAGNIRQLDELLPELADRFAQFADGSNKAALASAIFGEEAGPKMLALLNRGKAGLEELRRQLGSTFTAEDVQRARNYREVVGQLQIAFEQFFREITRAAGPQLTSILNQLTEYVRKVNDAVAANQRDSQMTRAAAEAYDREAAILRDLIAEHDLLKGVMESNSTLAQANQGEFNRLTAEIEAQRKKVNELVEALALLRGAYDNSTPPPARNDNRPQAPAMDPFAMEKAQIALDQIMERLSGQRDLFDEINFSWQEHANVVQQALAAIDRANETKHRRDAARHRFELQMRRLEQQAILDTATLAAQTITALWPKQKGAAIAAAIINTAVGVTKALSAAPPPWNFIQAALVAAAGAAQIATINSTTETGSSAGGSTPAVPQEAEAPMGRSLTIQGVDPGHLFSGGQVRGLIEMINEEVKNGATLISSGRLAA